MKLYSTNNKAHFVGLKEAVLKGLPEDNGLYMPERIPTLPSSFLENLEQYSFQDIAFTVANTLLQNALPESELKNIVYEAVNFPAPVVDLNDSLHILELFHGPSLAFKDFGARFMARLMGYFNKEEEKDLVILVATSGDTGGAVAYGFLNTPGIRVVILYPSGKVSPLQEKQLTTLGNNITALEIDGTFDDCQALVKKAFLDQDLRSKIRISSANSINIARLIPQSFYYFEAFKQLKEKENVTFVVPSGNFGNLTAGILAKRMGLNIDHFIAATNINNVVPEYLSSGRYTPRLSKRTISNAMDVGNPSNFARMDDLYCSTWNNFKQEITGYCITDHETEKEIQDIYKEYNYIIDPHGAVGTLSAKKHKLLNQKANLVVLETAHYSKFKETVDGVLDIDTDIPKRLKTLMQRKKQAESLDITYDTFKNWLEHNL